jgi:hypothetical protein
MEARFIQTLVALLAFEKAESRSHPCGCHEKRHWLSMVPTEAGHLAKTTIDVSKALWMTGRAGADDDMSVTKKHNSA